MTDSTGIYLSIIIPAYNEAARILPTLIKVRAFLATQPFASEIVVADDGSQDETAEIVTRFGEGCNTNVRLLRLPHRGKGGAVRRGMLEACGKYRFLCDADLSMPIEQITKFFPPAGQEIDVAIGSREAKGARRIGEPSYRHIIGRVSNFIIQIIAVRGFQDTQCGFKLFRNEAACWLFERQQIDGFGFDIEILFLAKRHGYRIHEIPIDWYYSDHSKVRPVHDTLATFRETMTVRLNAWRGRYAR